jgi:hypothetical protein
MMKKTPAIFDLHHQVLEAWCALRRTLKHPVPVWSFDYHTDTMPAFRHALPPPEPGDWRSPEKLAHALKHLRHDEHFDWALRAGAVSEIHLLSFYAPPEAPAHPAIKVHPAPGFPEQNEALNAPEMFRPFAAGFLSSEFIRRAFGGELPAPGDEYILDIDCDAILCEKTLDLPELELFGTLAANAALVTISRENDWVKLLKLPGENLSGRETAEKLCRIIDFFAKNI